MKLHWASILIHVIALSNIEEWSALHAVSAQDVRKGDAARLTCKPQGLLSFDHPYPKPRHTSGLPVCPQYSCSCCSKQHVSQIYRLLAPAMMPTTFDLDQQQQHRHKKKGKRKGETLQGKPESKGAEHGDDEDDGIITSQDWDQEEGLGVGDDSGLSDRCAGMLTLMACRVCDPQVGVGLKTAVCRSTCNAWYDACKQHYFTFEPLSGLLVGCPASGPGPGTSLPAQEMCVRMQDTVSSGEQLCELAGLPVADPSPSMPCFNGSDPSMPPGACDPPLDPTTSSQQQKQAEKKQRQKRKGKEGKDGEWQVGAVAVVVLIFVIILAAPRGVKWAKGSWQGWRLKLKQFMGVQVAQQAKRNLQAFKGKGQFAK